MSPSFRRLCRQNKYRVSPKKDRTYKGVVYASRAEALRASELDLLLRAGHVTSVTRQPRFTLGVPENVYVADFLVQYRCPATGAEFFAVEDVKGFETPAFKRNRRLWRRYGKHPLVILKRRGNDWQKENIWPEDLDPDAKASRKSKRGTR